jgi:urease accessory protein
MEEISVIHYPALILLHTYGGGGILSGFLHPLLGLDHLLAMLAVGLLSAQIGGRAIWTVPATFVVVMGLGGLLGILGMPLPVVEYGITGSVLILGIAIVANKRMPEWAAILIVALFALFHGHAHGTELPELTTTIGLMIAYITGFLIATAGLHVVGALVGIMAVRSERGITLLRLGGTAIALAGIFLIASV